jgi:hypothetical protein
MQNLKKSHHDTSMKSIKSEKGAVLVLFTILLPVLLAFIGFTTDSYILMREQQSLKWNLSYAGLDALDVYSSSTSCNLLKNSITESVKNTLSKLKTSYDTLNIEVGGFSISYNFENHNDPCSAPSSAISVSAVKRINTYIMAIFGSKYVTLKSTVIVNRDPSRALKNLPIDYIFDSW